MSRLAGAFLTSPRAAPSDLPAWKGRIRGGRSRWGPGIVRKRNGHYEETTILGEPAAGGNGRCAEAPAEGTAAVRHRNGRCAEAGAEAARAAGRAPAKGRNCGKSQPISRRCWQPGPCRPGPWDPVGAGFPLSARGGCVRPPPPPRRSLSSWPPLPLRKEGEGKQRDWKGEIRAGRGGNAKEGATEAQPVRRRKAREGGTARPRASPRCDKMEDGRAPGIGCGQRAEAALGAGEQVSLRPCVCFTAETLWFVTGHNRPLRSDTAHTPSSS